MTDVVVIGAGLAGLRTAIELRRRGVDVILVDRKRDVAESIQTTGIFVRRTFEDFAIPERQLGPAVRSVALYSPSGRRIDLRADHDEFRVGRMPVVYRESLDAAIRAGVEWLPASTLRSIILASGGSLLECDSAGKRQTIHARYVVGADGCSSTAARELDLDLNSRWIVGVEDVFEATGKGEPRFHVVLDPKIAPGYIGWIVEDGEEIHAGVGGYASRFDPASALAELKRRFAHLLPTGTPRERRGGKIPVNGVLSRIGNNRGLLVGDAAGAVSPLTAGGLDACFRLSATAAEIIAAYLATGDAAVLDLYSGKWLRSRFISRIWMRSMIDVVAQPLAAELAVATLRLVPQFAKQVFFGHGSFPDFDQEQVQRFLSAGSFAGHDL